MMHMPTKEHVGSEKVDRRGVEPRSPACKTGVLPFDQQPGLSSGASGSRTHKHEGLSFAALPVCIQRHVELQMLESNQPFRAYEAQLSVQPICKKVAREGIEPSFLT